MIATCELNDDIKMQHFDQAMDRVRSGLKKRKLLHPHEKKIAACHDAGHAVADWFMDGINTSLMKLSVMPDVNGKVVCSLPRLKFYINKTDVVNVIAFILSGRAAQKLIFDEFTTNFSGDLESATNLVTSLMVENGMSEKIGQLWFKSFYKVYENLCESGLKMRISDDISQNIFQEIKRILEEAFKIAENILLKRKDKLEKAANELIENDLIGLEELEKILGPNPFINMEMLTLSDESFLPVGLESWNN